VSVCAVLEVCRIFRCLISSDLYGRTFSDPVLGLCKDASHIPSIPPSFSVRRIEFRTTHCCGPGSSVGIATGYGLDGPGIEYSVCCEQRYEEVVLVRN
jgi:hypothetical protein